MKLLRASNYDKNRAYYYVDSHNMYGKINTSAGSTDIVITGRGGKTYTIKLYSEVERGLRIAHFLDLREPNSNYRHVETDPYSVFNDGTVSVSSDKYGTSSGY